MDQSGRSQPAELPHQQIWGENRRTGRKSNSTWPTCRTRTHGKGITESRKIKHETINNTLHTRSHPAPGIVPGGENMNIEKLGNKQPDSSDIVQGGPDHTSKETIHDALIVFFAILAAGAIAIFAVLHFTHAIDTHKTISPTKPVISR